MSSSFVRRVSTTANSIGKVADIDTFVEQLLAVRDATLLLSDQGPTHA